MSTRVEKIEESHVKSPPDNAGTSSIMEEEEEEVFVLRHHETTTPVRSSDPLAVYIESPPQTIVEVVATTTAKTKTAANIIATSSSSAAASITTATITTTTASVTVMTTTITTAISSAITTSTTMTTTTTSSLSRNNRRSPHPSGGGGGGGNGGGGGGGGLGGFGGLPPSPGSNGHNAPNRGFSRTCCLCWCCCCNCSKKDARCLSVRNNEEKSARARETNKLEILNGENEPPPTLEDIRAWGESFDRLMRCSAGRKVFRDFLRCEYSEENILFWLACEELKRETNAESVEEKARLIYEDYISILSPKEVSLDSRVREVINRNMVEPSPHTFDEAQLQIYTLMHRDSYPRFVNSPIYKKLAQVNTSSRKESSA